MKIIDKLKIEPLQNYLSSDLLFFYKSNIYFEVTFSASKQFQIKKNGPKLCSLKFELDLRTSSKLCLLYVDYDEKHNKINGFVLQNCEKGLYDPNIFRYYCTNKYTIIYYKRNKQIKTIAFEETYQMCWFGVFNDFLLIQNKNYDLVIFDPKVNELNSLDLLFEKPNWTGIRHFAINHSNHQVLLFQDRQCLLTKIDNRKFIVLNTINNISNDIISHCSFNKINSNVYSFIFMFDRKKTFNIKIAAIVNQNSLQMLNPNLKNTFNLISYQFNPVEMKKVLQRWISINDLLYIVFSYIV